MSKVIGHRIDHNGAGAQRDNTLPWGPTAIFLTPENSYGRPLSLVPAIFIIISFSVLLKTEHEKQSSSPGGNVLTRLKVISRQSHYLVLPSFGDHMETSMKWLIITSLFMTASYFWLKRSPNSNKPKYLLKYPPPSPQNALKRNQPPPGDGDLKWLLL